MTPALGEIRAFAGNFAPRGFALCNGQLLQINENEALFALIGTTYGGNGVSTFGLPDLRGRVLISQGQGPGLSSRPLGQASGTESVTLSQQQLPTHNHNAAAAGTAGNQSSPTNNVLAAPVNVTTPTDGMLLYLPASTQTKTVLALDPTTIGLNVGNLPHENRMPIVTISYIIALQGIFPSFN
jgi:microcystin-dependent protein